MIFRQVLEAQRKYSMVDFIAVLSQYMLDTACNVDSMTKKIRFDILRRELVHNGRFRDAFILYFMSYKTSKVFPIDTIGDLLEPLEGAEFSIPSLSVIYRQCKN